MAHRCSNSEVVQYRSPSALVVGRGEPVRVNVSVGLNVADRRHCESELRKIETIIAHRRPPDLMMDLSIVRPEVELWRGLVERFTGPVGVLPHYLVFDDKKGIDRNELLERANELVAGGISFLTVHFTPNRELMNLAATSRLTPVTSRGGSVVIRDMLLNERQESVYIDIFDELVSLSARSGVVLNFGTAFRAANVLDGLDQVARAEISRQRALIRQAVAGGAKVVLEGPGHVTMSQIDEYVQLVKDAQVPLMPLGPMVTDAFPGTDHVTNAIGASLLAMRAEGGVINAVTRAEHTGGVPNITQTLEALDAAHVAAHAATITYHAKSRENDRFLAERRAQFQTCVVPLGAKLTKTLAPGCTRCGHLCPLIAPSDDGGSMAP